MRSCEKSFRIKKVWIRKEKIYEKGAGWRFFDPKAYVGTSRGQKNDKLVQKKIPLDRVSFFQ
jgi:hypothetical protein